MNIKSEKLKEEFPILSRKIEGTELVYLDNAATTQKPISVIKCLEDFYNTSYANVHRGVHYLSQEATDAMENARNIMRGFIGAPSSDEIIFTSGTTESINLLASVIQLKANDEIILSVAEHHSNIVPWQFAAEKTGAIIKVAPIKSDGSLDVEVFQKLLNKKTKIVSMSHITNVLGVINPIRTLAELTHALSPAVFIVDGAQAAGHIPIDVKELGVDFYCFSGHKMYAPSGIGVLWGKAKLLNSLPPYQGGGEMIKHVSFEKTTYTDLPFKYEAGTPFIEGSVALACAATFLQKLGMDNIKNHDSELLAYAENKMKKINGLITYASCDDRSSVFSFNIEGLHPSDVGTLLDNQGVAVRTGHHCAQPLMRLLGVEGTIRVSFAVYNTKQDIDKLYSATKKALEILK